MWQMESNPDSWLDVQADLHRWYDSPAGEMMLELIRRELDGLLPSVFGYQGVQVGQPKPGVNLLRDASLLRELVLDADTARVGADIYGEPHRLPLANDSIQLALLMHTLDFTEQPHQVLRELDRVLVSDGYVVVVGFNPHSLLGLRRLLSLRSSMPWQGRFYSRLRVSDWLSLLSYRELKARSFAQRESGLAFIHQKLRRLGANVAPVYVLLARKHSIPLNPSVSQLWRPRRGNVVHAVFAGAERGVKRNQPDQEQPQA